jgi:hypothetical protein
MNSRHGDTGTGSRGHLGLEILLSPRRRVSVSPCPSLLHPSAFILIPLASSTVFAVKILSVSLTGACGCLLQGA